MYSYKLTGIGAFYDYNRLHVAGPRRFGAICGDDGYAATVLFTIATASLLINNFKITLPFAFHQSSTEE
jgi:hypothetical protein